MITSLSRRERGVGPSRGGTGRRQRVLGNSTSRGVLALGCVLAGALLTAGPASAASRGFRIFNDSRYPLKLVSATKVEKEIRNPVIHVVPDTPIGFEGRPADGSVLAPGATQRWELKHSSGGQYAAVLTYDIVGTSSPYAPLPGHLKVIIQTTPLSNNSDCVVRTSTGGLGCDAEPFMGGRKITFVDLNHPGLLSGGPGNDRISGGPGNDRISGGPGNDRISGGPGNDFISGGPGNDTIHARDGHRDVVDCGPGRDVAFVDPVDLVRGCERVVR